MADLDEQIRVRVFEWLAEQRLTRGEVLPRTLLAEGIRFEGERVPLLGPQGIFRPRYLYYPLSITTTPNGPYDDVFAPDGLLAYRYRGTDPNHPDNVGLRRAMADGVPLVYFHGLVPGRYIATWPVFIVDDDPATLTFRVAVDDLSTSARESLAASVGEGPMARRAYITTAARKRLHQHSFREIVLRAYREQCALCRIRHRELLDAAHIIEDTHPDGRPEIPNGISLCKLHHAAFDACLVGISPDYRVEVRGDLLDEIDGPMLEHGLKELHRGKLILPRRRDAWPDRDALDIRYRRFRDAS